MGSSTNSDLEAILAKNRIEGRRYANELLCENITSSLYWGYFDSEIEQEIKDKKVELQYCNYHPVVVKLYTAFSGTVTYLSPGAVHNILQYGAARRIGSIYEAIKVVCKIAYFGRKEPLSIDESRSLNDSLLLIYVHMIGVFDALAIAFHRVSDPPMKLPEKQADLLARKFRNLIGDAELNKVFEGNDSWFLRVKDELRNRYVHRVPPYVPTAGYSPEDAKESNRIQAERLLALKEGRFDDTKALYEKEQSLGQFLPWISFVDSDMHMPLLSTVLDDVLRFSELSLSVLERLEHYPFILARILRR
jgi:hypothetical protein